MQSLRAFDGTAVAKVYVHGPVKRSAVKAAIEAPVEKVYPMNSPHYHAVIWVDHREARIFHLSPTDVDRSVLHPNHPTKHIHHKANSIGSGHAQDDQNYFQAIMEAVAGSGALLITGPANAKTELLKHIHQHDPRMMKTVVGIETVDHPSDAQLVAYARKYFEGTDRMQPQIR